MHLSKETIKYRRSLLLQHAKAASGILHLGAHKGQEAKGYDRLGKKVVWVEAIPRIHEVLSDNIKPYAKQRALCALLSSVNGRQYKFNISNNFHGVSSSIFEFGEYSEGENTLWPDQNLHMVCHITLPSIRLDDLLASNDIASKDYDFWVLDLQGAEKLALQGSREALKNCKAIYAEVSTVEVYKNAVLWTDLKNWLAEKNFFPLWEPEIKHDDVLFVHKTDID